MADRDNMPKNDDAASRLEYDPDRLLDTLISMLRLKNDAALCRVLEIDPALVIAVRHRIAPVRDSMLIRMHEVSGLSIRGLKGFMGAPRSAFRGHQ